MNSSSYLEGAAVAVELAANLSFGAVVLMSRQLKHTLIKIIQADRNKHLPHCYQVMSTSLLVSEENEQRLGQDTGNAGHTVSLCF